MQNKVRTRTGSYIGVKEGKCVVFKGIPYAKAPVGELRFCAPQKLEESDEEYVADHYGNRCLQTVWDGPDGFYSKEFPIQGEQNTAISEDCLYLNIWTPETESGSLRPVLFYIHGGGLLGGTGHEIEFVTDAYAKRDIILVTINYRCGITGFLSHPLLAKEDPEAVGCYGILDQIAALAWVNENIRAFGGDAGNITLCGQSAGGMSIETILSCRKADHLYQKVIIQSASGYPHLVMADQEYEKAMAQGKHALELAGISTLKELRGLSPDDLLKIQGKLIMEAMRASGPLPFAPAINRVLLGEFLTPAIEHGHMNCVPTMIGCTKNDIATAPEEAILCEGRMTRSDIAYSLMNEKTQKNPAYVYYFRRDLPGDGAGAFHSSELWYTFGTLDKCWRPMTEGDRRLSEEMINYWSNFIRTGVPENEDTKEWKPCSCANPFVKVFDVL